MSTRMIPMSEFEIDNGENCLVNGEDESTAGIQPLSLFERDEFSVESIISRSSFSVVYRVRFGDGKVQVRHRVAYDPSASEADLKSAFAMKCLTPPSEMRTQESFLSVARNLYYEASILSRLNHPNIIKIRGVSMSGFPTRGCSQLDSASHFILLELLQGTLRNRLDLWRIQQSRLFKGTTPPFEVPGGSQVRSLSHWHGRLKIALEIADGMKYIHSQGIVFQHLAPENVGFDSKDGSVKLFDFGVARPLQESFAESAEVGRFRYMAPENILCQPSGYPADVYSFGVLLWELATLKLPFAAFIGIDKATKQEYFAQTKFTSQVILKSWRPETEDIDCLSTKELIKICWAAKPELRPSFQDVVENINKTYRRHLEVHANDESGTSRRRALLGWALLRSGSFTNIQRSRSFDRRVCETSDMRRTASGGRVNALKITHKPSGTHSDDETFRRFSLPNYNTLSSSNQSKSDYENSMKSTQETAAEPMHEQKNGPFVGRLILRRVPSRGRINGRLSTSSHTASTTSLPSGDDSEIIISDQDENDESCNSFVQLLTPLTPLTPLSQLHGKRKEDVRHPLSAASKELLTNPRQSRSLALPTINSLSSEQSSSSLPLDDPTPLPTPLPIAEPQPRKRRNSSLSRGCRIRSLSISSRTEATEKSVEEGGEMEEPSHDAWTPTIDSHGEIFSSWEEARKPRQTKSLIGGRPSLSTGSVKLFRNLSGVLMRKKRQSSWSSSSLTGSSSSHISNTTNAVWDALPEKSCEKATVAAVACRRVTTVRRHLKGTRAELSASQYRDA